MDSPFDTLRLPGPFARRRGPDPDPDPEPTTTPKRHWRIFITENHGSDSAGIARRQFHESAWGSAVATDSGVASASGSFSSNNTPDVAFSNIFPVTRRESEEHTWFSDQTGGPWWIAYDFGEGNEVAIDAVTLINPIRATGDTYDVSVLSFEVQSSDDGSSWQTEWEATGNSDINAAAKRHIRPEAEVSYTGSPHGAHTQWRTFFDRETRYVGFAQIEMRDAPGGNDQSSLSNFSGSSQFDDSNFAIANAFDGDPSTTWITEADENINWLQLESSTEFEVSEIALRERASGDSHWPRYMFVAHRDGSGPWTIAFVESNMRPGPGLGNWRTHQDENYIT